MPKMNSTPQTKPKFIRKMVLGMVVLSIISIFGIALISNIIVRDFIYDNVLGMARRDGVIHAEQIDEWFVTAGQTVRSFASVLDTLTSVEYYEALAARFTSEYDFVENVFIGFADGSVINGLGWRPKDAGRELDGIGWGPWEGWRSVERPWFEDSQAAGYGRVIITAPYFSHSTGNFTAAMGTLLPELAGVGGAVGFSVSLEDILEEVGELSVMGGGYVLLIGAQGEIVVHPNLEYTREVTHLRDIPNGDFLMAGIEAGEQLVLFNDYTMGTAYFITVPLESVGWTLAMVIPSMVTADMVFPYMVVIVSVFAAFMLIVLGVTAVVIGGISRRMAQKEREENEAVETRIQLMLDAAPMAIFLYDESLKAIDCNIKAVEIFGFTDKKEAYEQFVKTLPPTQPNGEDSKKALEALVAQAFNEGSVTSDFVLQKADGTPIPAEMTHVRVRYKDTYAVAEYTRDLREVKAAEELNEKLINALPMFIEFWDANGNFIDCNQRTVEMLGLTGKKEYIERYYDHQPELQPCGTPSNVKIPAFVKKTLEEGYARSEWMLLQTNGEQLPVEAIFTRLDLQGEAMVVCINLDMREVKDAIEREREAGELNEIFINNSPLVMNIWDEATNMVSTSQQAVEMFELDSMEQYLEQFFDLSPEYQPCGVSSREKSLMYNTQAFNEGYVRFEWMHQKLNGEPVPTEIILSRFTRGGTPYLAAFTIDLRPAIAIQQKETEQTVRRRMQAMLNSSPLACFIIDENFKVVELNEATINLFNAKSKQDFIDNFFRVIPEYQPDGTLTMQVMGERMNSMDESCHYEFLAQTLQGEELPCEIYATRFDVTMSTVHIRDLRDFYRMQKEQRELFAKLEAAIEGERAANSAKSKFLSNMSHEIRTPMSAIIGMTGIAKNTNDPQKISDCLNKTEKASKHLLGIINQILDISKIEAESFELDSHTFQFRKMADEVTSVLSASIDEKRLTLEVELDKAIPRFIVSDELRLAQVLTNLLTNAIKFTPEGGKVSLTAVMNGGDMRVEVDDTGIGIPKEQQSLLFGAFVQAESGTARKFGGTGLGLSISKWIVEMMGGKIWVESEQGNGARFIFTIPVKAGVATDEDSHTAFNAAASGDVEPDCYKGYTILVAEDVDINREIVTALLEPTGLKIECAFDGEQAVQMFETAPERYDLIFMDVQMPGMDGITATRLIRKLDTPKAKSIPIVAMTANVFREDIDACLEAGMNGHLSKPLDFDQMMAILQLHLT